MPPETQIRGLKLVVRLKPERGERLRKRGRDEIPLGPMPTLANVYLKSNEFFNVKADTTLEQAIEEGGLSLKGFSPLHPQGFPSRRKPVLKKVHCQFYGKAFGTHIIMALTVSISRITSLCLS